MTTTLQIPTQRLSTFFVPRPTFIFKKKSYAPPWLETLQYILHMYSKGFIKTLLQILFNCYSLQWEPCPWRWLQICLIWGTNFVSFSLKSPRFVISSRFLLAFSLSFSRKRSYINSLILNPHAPPKYCHAPPVGRAPHLEKHWSRCRCGLSVGYKT